MKPELKTRWLEALRSGRYAQGKAVLRNSDNRFCCLGVLCDTAKDQFGLGEWRREGSLYRIGFCEAIIVDELRGKLGLSKTLHDELIAMNDTGKSFSKIADYVEANL